MSVCIAISQYSLRTRLTVMRGGGWRRTDLPVGQSVEDGFLDLVRVVIESHMLQHHHATQQQGGRIRESLAGNIRGGTVDGLEDGALVADVAGWGEAQAADQAGAHVGQDVAVEVGHDEDLVVVGGRVGDDLQARVVQQLGVEVDVRKVLADLARDAQEQAVGHLHDRRFVHRPHFSFADVFGVLEGEAEDSFGRGARDEFDALDDAVHDHVLDARVFAFRVLADQRDVDVVVGRLVAGDGLAGTEVGEEVEGSAEGQVERDVAFADGRLMAGLVECICMAAFPQIDLQLEGLSAPRSSS